MKVLILSEGVKRLNNGDLKGFDNLIYLRLPNSIKYIEEDVFNDTPCLNYENISDHPIIRRIKAQKFFQMYKNNNNDFNIIKLLRSCPLFDKLNYDFENNNKDNKTNKYEKDNYKSEREYELLKKKN